MTQRTWNNRAKLLVAALATLIMSGCSTLELAVSDEFKYGRIYAMKTAFIEAVDNCGDHDKVSAALHWAQVGKADLPDYMRYMGHDAAMAEQGRALAKALQSVSQIKHDSPAACEQMREASLISKQFTLALSDFATTSTMVALND